MSNPALQIIEKLGGALAVAEGLKIDVSSVHKWTYPKEKGGTDGRIPSKRQEEIIKLGRKLKKPIFPNEFFEMPRTGVNP